MFWWLALATCLRVEGPVVRGLKYFHGLPRESLSSRTSSRKKHLDKIFKIFVLSVLATCSWLDLVAKNACFMFQGQFLKLFNSPSTFLWLFIVFLISSLSQTHRTLNPNLHCWSSLQPYSPRKRYGFLLSYSILHVYKCISSFLWDFVEFVCFAMIRT